MLYVIRAGDTDKTKIGWAGTSVEERRMELQAGSWERLVVVRTIEGDRLAEAWMHRQFRQQRIARDWFRFDERMLTIVPPEPRALAVANGDMDEGMRLLRAKRGAMSAAARGVGVSKQAVTQWLRVPAEYLPAVELATGISRNELRPDICPSLSTEVA